MKKYLLALLLVVCLFCLSATTFAGSGSAVISHYYASTASGYTFCLHISNITSNVINIKVTLYKHDGTIVTGSNIPNQNEPGVTNWNNNLSDASASFSLNANCTVVLHINFSSGSAGYGTIEWNQNSKETQGLVAYGEGIGSSSCNYMTESILINAGQPF